MFDLATNTSPSEAILHILDEGPGIPDNRLETVFHRFYSERPKSESFGNHSGLGLSIAKQIIEGHGGSLVASNRDRWGVFYPNPACIVAASFAPRSHSVGATVESFYRGFR